MWYDIVGYTYEADWHCVPCTVERFGNAPESRETVTDSEGNRIHAVVARDVTADDRDAVCGSCRERIDAVCDPAGDAWHEQNAYAWARAQGRYVHPYGDGMDVPEYVAENAYDLFVAYRASDEHDDESAFLGAWDDALSSHCDEIVAQTRADERSTYETDLLALVC